MHVKYVKSLLLLGSRFSCNYEKMFEMEMTFKIMIDFFTFSIASVTVPILLLHAEDDFTIPHELCELVRIFYVYINRY